MKKIVFLSTIIIAFILPVKAQNSNNNSDKKQTTTIEGTYQVQVVNSRNQPYFPANLEELVTKNRKETQTTYVTLGTEVRLMILPFSEINKPDFKPLEKVAHVAE